MVLSVSGSNETRDCLDPWTTVYINATGEVATCCWSKPIGNLNDQTIDEILEGEPVRAYRSGLLTGDLPEDCAKCPARAHVPLGELEKKLAKLDRDALREPDFESHSRIRSLERRRFELKDEVARCEDATEGKRLSRELSEVDRELGKLTYAMRKPLRALVKRRIARILSFGRGNP